MAAAEIPGPAGASPEHAITGRNGRRVRSNAFAGSPTGPVSVAVVDESGRILGRWHAPRWGQPGLAAATMAGIWRAATAGQSTIDARLGLELTWVLPRGQVRADPDGRYVRLVGADGDQVAGAHWGTAAWRERPERCMRAILTGIRGLAS